MASDDNDRDTEYALSRLLQMNTVAEYQNEFEMLRNRVAGKSESLLTTIYISGLKVALQIELLRSRPTTLGEGSLDVDEDIGVDEVSSERDGVSILWVYREKGRGVVEGGRVLCDVQVNGRRKKKKMKSSIQERLWDPGIKSDFHDNTLRVFSIWKAFGGNTRDLGSFGEETDKITNQHQDSRRFVLTEPGDGVTSSTRHRHNPYSDDVTIFHDDVSPHRLTRRSRRFYS
ncbi:hypothetical protein Tco_0431463 [Tanacetum coccineum]